MQYITLGNLEEKNRTCFGTLLFCFLVLLICSKIAVSSSVLRVDRDNEIGPACTRAQKGDVQSWGTY